MASILLADRKRTVLAIGLLGIMAIMWARVLVGKKPQAAAASVPEAAQNGSPAAAAKAEPHVAYVALPVIVGRHDGIRRDFFDPVGWQSFAKEGGTENPAQDAGPPQNSENVIQQAAKGLKLEAIILGDHPQAYINDKPVSQGEKVYVREGTAQYEFEVTQIREDTVTVRSGNTQVILRLMQAFDVEH